MGGGGSKCCDWDGLEGRALRIEQSGGGGGQALRLEQTRWLSTAPRRDVEGCHLEKYSIKLPLEKLSL